MKKWSILVLIAILALLMPVSTASVSAQDEISLSKSADLTSATVGDTITYTYTITNTDNVTINDITLDDNPLGPINLGGQTSLNAGATITATATYTVADTDLPGPLVNTATVSGIDPDGNPITDEVSLSIPLTSSASAALQLTKTADKTSASFGDTITYTYTITNTGNTTVSNVTLVDNKLGQIYLGGSENITLACCRPNHILPWQKHHIHLRHHHHEDGNDNITLAPGDTVTATATHIVSFADLRRGNAIVNKATVKGTDPTGRRVTASATATVSINNTFPWKRNILQQSGIPGKGIEKAPGLQKPFNPNSQAAEHAGKKDKPKMPEQLQLRESIENQGTEQQLQIQLEVENKAGNGQATQNEDEAGSGKGQMKENCNTDNQAWKYETNGKCNKPDKEKTGK
jgi:plastocyanin